MTDGSVTQSIAGQFAEAQDGDLQGVSMKVLKLKRAQGRSTRKAPRASAPSRDDERQERGDMQRTHAILMDVHAHASLLVAALDSESLHVHPRDEDDCVGHGGPELTAKAIKAMIREALYCLDHYDILDALNRLEGLPGHQAADQAADIRGELFDVWNMAALAAHALAPDAPLLGEGVSPYPAIAAVRAVAKSADQLTARLDELMCKAARKRAA